MTRIQKKSFHSIPLSLAMNQIFLVVLFLAITATVQGSSIFNYFKGKSAKVLKLGSLSSKVPLFNSKKAAFKPPPPLSSYLEPPSEFCAIGVDGLMGRILNSSDERALYCQNANELILKLDSDSVLAGADRSRRGKSFILALMRKCARLGGDYIPANQAVNFDKCMDEVAIKAKSFTETDFKAFMLNGEGLEACKKVSQFKRQLEGYLNNAPKESLAAAAINSKLNSKPVEVGKTTEDRALKKLSGFFTLLKDNQTFKAALNEFKKETHLGGMVPYLTHDGTIYEQDWAAIDKA